MKNIDILIDELCVMIESLESKKKLNELSQLIDTDEDLKVLIGAFESAKEKYYEVTKYSTHHPDFKKVANDLILAKENLYKNEKIKAFKDVENELSMLVMNLNKQLKDIVPKSKKTCH